MADFTVTWATIAFEQYWSLTDAVRDQVSQRVHELRRDPTGHLENYNPATDLWTVDYGAGAGLLVYAAVPQRQRVIILRNHRPQLGGGRRRAEIGRLRSATVLASNSR